MNCIIHNLRWTTIYYSLFLISLLFAKSIFPPEIWVLQLTLWWEAQEGIHFLRLNFIRERNVGDQIPTPFETKRNRKSSLTMRVQIYPNNYTNPCLAPLFQPLIIPKSSLSLSQKYKFPLPQTSVKNYRNPKRLKKGKRLIFLGLSHATGKINSAIKGHLLVG